MHCQLPCWPLCACLVLGGLYTFQSLCLASASFSTFNVCNFLRPPRLFPLPPPGGCRPALPSGLFRPCRLRGPALPALPGPALPVARPWVLVPWPWPRVDTHFGVWYWRPPASLHVPYELPCVGGNIVIVTFLAGYVHWPQWATLCLWILPSCSVEVYAPSLHSVLCIHCQA